MDLITGELDYDPDLERDYADFVRDERVSVEEYEEQQEMVRRELEYEQHQMIQDHAKELINNIKLKEHIYG